MGTENNKEINRFDSESCYLKTDTDWQMPTLDSCNEHDGHLAQRRSCFFFFLFCLCCCNFGNASITCAWYVKYFAHLNYCVKFSMNSISITEKIFLWDARYMKYFIRIPSQCVKDLKRVVLSGICNYMYYILPLSKYTEYLIYTYVWPNDPSSDEYRGILCKIANVWWSVCWI